MSTGRVSFMRGTMALPVLASKLGETEARRMNEWAGYRPAAGCTRWLRA